jgi:hypothetical protein
MISPELRRLTGKSNREPIVSRIQACVGKDIEKGMPFKQQSITVGLDAFFERIERNLENLICVFSVIE